ncbi:hypothetical protein SAMN05216412_11328 [Nitrosospira multiformis]|uniref:Uncharacterized protein n=1 Tax=Nitrosospira multiformis TaxID=1231 RepID=A0A1I0GHL6_9PROT|nr:hypothetical protein SAMN05216412_11328 [Nitrosospira multiformis]
MEGEEKPEHKIIMLLPPIYRPGPEVHSPFMFMGAWVFIFHSCIACPFLLRFSL